LTKGISRKLSQTGKTIFEIISNNSEKLSSKIQSALDLEKPSLALTQHTAYTYNRLFNEECKKRGIYYGSKIKKQELLVLLQNYTLNLDT
jgi:hypothetical protein